MMNVIRNNIIIIALLQIMGERLDLLCSHEALILLRHCFSIPNVLYILSTAPCFLSFHLKSFDDLLRSTLSNIVNISLDSDVAWLQASLPVKVGGIGIRRSTHLAPSAFLASAAGCADMIHQILPPHIIKNDSLYIESALSIWADDHSHYLPSHPLSCSQRAWDASKIEAYVVTLQQSAADDLTKARLLSVFCPESGTWLNALPISSVCLRMDDEVVRIAVGLRLGLPLCHPHLCSGCGAEVGEDGIHGLSCRYSKYRHSRHVELNDIVKCSLDAAKIPSHLEPLGLYRSDGKRPDGASVVPWQRGKILVWDVTCSDSLAPSLRDIAIREPGAVAAAAEYRKSSKYAHLNATYHFIPIAVETLGVLGKDSFGILLSA